MKDERKIGGISLFSLWAGASISLAEIMTGSLIAPIGLVKGILLILVGHLIGCLILALVGIIGFREKKPALISSRISLGKYGSYILSIFNIVQLIGWTAIMLIQCSKSVQSITSDIFGQNTFVFLVIILGIIVLIWALCSDKGVNIINNLAVLLLLVLSFVMLYAISKGGASVPISGALSIGAALEFSIVMPLSWVPLISDYTMAAKSAKESFWGSFLGYFVGSSFMYIIGFLTAIYTGASDPITALSNLHLGVPALLIVVLATVTTTFLDVYSAVLSTVNLTEKIPKKILIVIFSLLGIVLALFFPMEAYQNFLYMIGSIFAPIFSIILVQYFIYKDDYSDKLINLAAIIAAALGTCSYYLVTKFDLPIGSTIPSMVVAFIKLIDKLNGDELES